jgi:hypothetical protein
VALSRHFVPGYDRTVPPGTKPLRLRGNESSQTFLNLVPFAAVNKSSVAPTAAQSVVNVVATALLSDTVQDI